MDNHQNNCACECVLSYISCVWLFVTLWTIALLASLSVGFFRQNMGVGFHALLQGLFSTQGSNQLFSYVSSIGRWVLYHWATWQPPEQLQEKTINCRANLKDGGKHKSWYHHPHKPSKCSSVSSVQFSLSVMSDSLQPHESQHTRPPCPSPPPGVHSNSHPSSWWCHPAISSSVVPFSSCSQSLPASESFPMSQLFAWGGQSTGVSALASFLPKNTQGWSPLLFS